MQDKFRLYREANRADPGSDATKAAKKEFQGAEEEWKKFRHAHLKAAADPDYGNSTTENETAELEKALFVLLAEMAEAKADIVAAMPVGAHACAFFPCTMHHR